jgi:hypothetical protein
MNCVEGEMGLHHNSQWKYKTEKPGTYPNMSINMFG